MGRPLLIVALVGALMASGVAVASPANEIHIPVSVQASEPTWSTVIVEKGDHLWKISARQVEEFDRQAPVAPYWRQVVDVNTPSLRSGDPDLIYPGEVIELPPTSERR